MVDYGVAISLIVLSVFALFTDILAIIVIAHYFPFFHGTDVTLMSLMFAMAGNAIVVLPIPAFIEVLGKQWTSGLCTGYVWGFLTFRLSQMLSLAILTIHWSTLLKMSAERKSYFSTKLLKISIVFVWISSVLFGCLPLLGVADRSYNKDQTCKFLSFNLGTGFGLFFIIANIACMIVSIICATDATFLIKHMKRIAKTKYNTSRFHIPDSRADIPGQVINYVTERYHRLNFAWDLSRFVLVFVLIAFLLNHLPYTVIQGLQVFTQIDRGVLEVVSLYLVAAEALLIPHSLWLISKRYRHGLSYLWRVHLLRKTEDKEEDQLSCLQQSYTQREKDRVSVAPSRPPSSQGRTGGYSVSASGTLRSVKSDVLGRELLQPNGRTQITTLPSPKTHKHTAQANGVIKGEVKVEYHNNVYDERAVDTHGLEASRSITPTVSDRGEADIRAELKTGGSDVKTRDTLDVSRLDVKRSSSGASRKEWKEQMRLKHLPPIFVNDNYDIGDKKRASMRAEDTTVKSSPLAESGTSLHYYMSSDYHPDFLTDSLPRHKLAQALSTESEDNGAVLKVGRSYHDSDIDEVLTAPSPTDEQYWIQRREQFINSQKNSKEGKKLVMSTFKDPFDESKLSSHDKVDKIDPVSAKSVYGTYEDLSVSNIPVESEVVFNVDSIPADHIRDGYNSLRRIRRKEGERYNLQTGLNYSFSERSCASSTSTNSPDFRSLGRSKKRYISNPVYPVQGLAQKPTTQTDGRFYFSFRNSESNNIASQVNTSNTVATTKSSNCTVFQTDSSRHVYSGPGLFRNDSRRLSDRFNIDDSASNSQPNSSKSSNTDSHVPNSSLEEENESSGSSSSVTISPYKDGLRHKPWLEDIDIQYGDKLMLQMTEPLCGESDTDTLKDSHDSLEFRNSDSKHTHSNMSTPVSSLFDEETDRGFEEAIEQHVTLTPGISVYGGVGLCFESIKEEPEDLTSSGSNQFLDTPSNGEDEFRTLAVVSRNSNSRPSSVASADREEISYLQDTTMASTAFRTEKEHVNKVRTYQFQDSEYEYEHGDSGFTSGLERGNWSDSSGYQDITPRAENVSPWPDHPDVVLDTENAFESDFCFQDNHESVAKSEDMFTGRPSSNQSKPTRNKLLSQKTFDKSSIDKNVQSSKGGNRLVHRDVRRLTSSTGQSVVRVRSLDDKSPVAPRKQPKRVSSFEIRQNVRPAYF